MIDIQYIRAHADEVKKNCERRQVNVDIDTLLGLDEQRRGLIGEIDTLRSAKKSAGKPTPEEIAAIREQKEQLKQKEAQLAEVQAQYHALLMLVPNHTHPDVPAGGEDDFNQLELRGTAPTLTDPKDHLTLMTDLDLLDFERGAKVVGSKFYYLKGDAVRLNRAMISYGIDVLSKHGYELFETPDLAKHEIIKGLGFNPRGESTQIYNIEGMDLSLIGTAEITIGGYHQGEILDLSDGPKKYVALSHCFRTEDGAYGRTSKGLYRVHQFTKLEMFIFCKPEESEELHQELLEIEKEICDGLELHYQVVDIAAGDLGGPAYRKYDIEAWMSMKDGDFGEITSTSNCLDYQARRLNVRYKKEDGTNAFVHTLNGTAVVLSRFPIALIEQHQTEDGRIRIPAALQPYMGGQTHLG
jgi:seryl-tRNA synthetase